MKIYKALGIMSGSSLDGVDLAYCEFQQFNGKWRYNIGAAETIPFGSDWRSRLADTMIQSGLELALTHKDFGRYLGTLAVDFVLKHNLKPGFIASHGHTVFHQPERGLTLQIGSGAEIAAATGLTVICDFRSTDVAYGGQGAPLVPVGDMLLFSDYSCCLNLGGFANISYQKNNHRVAFDICPVNNILNFLAEKLGYHYDKNGDIAASGSLRVDLLNALEAIPFYSKQPPRSLGKEWMNESFLPVIAAFNYPVCDLLHTVTEHIAKQISYAAGNMTPGKLLVTGGGAKNAYLIKRLESLTKHGVVIPEEKLIDFKEALVFAFLGVLRIRDEVNSLASVTGASTNCSSGAIYNAAH